MDARRDGRRLLLVTAGAGYGKTSLVASWVRADGTPGIWLPLGPLDADPQAFAARLLGALASGSEPAALGPDPEGGGSDDLRRLVGPLLRAAQRRPDLAWIVLDDAHVLSGAPPALRLIELLANHLPSRVLLIVASRERLPLAIARLRSRGEAAELTARDLAFTAEETAALFARRFPGRTLSRSTARRLAARTEGWAAGLEILFQSLREASDAATAAALARPGPAGAGWFAYFAEEVLRNLPDPDQRLLLRASALPRLAPELCARVLGRTDGARLFALLRRRHLFVFPVGRKRDGYRWHHLFQRFLRRRLERELPAADRRTLWRRTAAALRAERSWPEAVAACAEAGDPVEALRLLEQHGEEMLASGRYGLLRRTLDRIPPAALARSSAALLLRGRLADVRGDWPEADASYGRALRAGASGERKIALLGLRAQFRMRIGEYAACLRLARRGLAAGSARGPRMSRLRGRLLAFSGVATCELGRLSEGEALLRQALALHLRSGDDEGAARVHYLLMGNVHVRRGDFAEAVEAARSALLAARRSGDPLRVCHSLAALAYARASGGEGATARAEAVEALRLAEALEYRMIEGYAQYTLGLCALLARDAAAARESFEAARRLGERVPETGLRTFPLTGLARAALAAGNRHAARRHAGRALTVARSLRDPFQEAEASLLLGASCAARESAERTRLWRRAEQLLRRLGLRYDLHRLLLLRLEAERPPRDEPYAELLAGAARLEHDFLFHALEPERGARVLAEALRRGIEPEYASGLLVRIGPPAAPALAPLLEPGVPAAVRARAAAALARIDGPVERGGVETGASAFTVARSLAEASAGAETGAKTATKTARKTAANPATRMAAGTGTRTAAKTAARTATKTAGRATAMTGPTSAPTTATAAAPAAGSAPRMAVVGSPPPLRISALGPLRVETGGRTLSYGDWRSGRARRLFAFLLVHRFRWVPLDVVLEGLWPEVEPARGLNNLNQSAWWLRGALDPEDRHPRRLRRVEETCRLDPGEGYAYDVEEFERALAQADLSWGPGRRDRAAPHLRRAVELYSGDFLAELPYEEFASVERERLRDRFRRALGRLVRIEADAERWDEVIPLSRRGVQDDPLSEEFQYALIRGLHRVGHRQEALEAYHRFETAMVRELDLPPSERMRALAVAVEGSGAHGPLRARGPGG